MSFIRADISIRTPTIPGMEIEQPVYFGSGDDSGVVVYISVDIIKYRLEF